MLRFRPIVSRARCGLALRHEIFRPLPVQTIARRNYKYDGISVSSKVMTAYKYGSAILIAAIVAVSFGLLGPRAIAAYEGNAIDEPPSSWKRDWKHRYRIYLYSEAHGSKPSILLLAYKNLLVEILQSEGYDVSLDTVFQSPAPTFTDKSDNWLSGLAFLYTKCGDLLYVGGRLDDATEMYLKSLQVYSGFDKHVGAAYAGIADVYSVKGEREKAKEARKCAVVVSCDPRVLARYGVDSLARGLEAIDELSIVKLDSNPTTAFVQNLTDLGIAYSQRQEHEKALRIYLSLLRLITESKENSAFPECKLQVVDEAKMKLFVSQTLWALGLREAALEWAKMTYDEAMLNYMTDSASIAVARSAMLDLARIYKNLGREEDAEDAVVQADRIHSDPSLDLPWDFGFRI